MPEQSAKEKKEIYGLHFFIASWMDTRETTPSNLRKIVGFNLLHR